MNLPESFKKVLTKFCQLVRKIIFSLGIILLVSVIFSFTDLPFWSYYWLGTHNADLEKDPDLIVVMGGGGMPSPDGLIRCYFAAEIANQYPEAFVLIAVPSDTSLREDSPELIMCRELQMRGIDSIRIFYESRGVNTRTQAMNIAGMFSREVKDTLGIRIVTSPEHMYRSVAVFRKAGFRHVGGQPSFEKAIDEELLVKKKKGEIKPSDLKGLGLRYNMWNYLKYEITVLRELCAIAWYRIRGWI
jgi:uncharacterized SAM-binding protein YcdF (DUF218 family)